MVSFDISRGLPSLQDTYFLVKIFFHGLTNVGVGSRRQAKEEVVEGQGYVLASHLGVLFERG